ncbi:TPA: hypothetical protein DDZ06_00930 [Candidatus Uhrbacteria bacterium]|nr:hypothetical protein [Candidatus Uhrbacteria bacterium]
MIASPSISEVRWTLTSASGDPATGGTASAGVADREDSEVGRKKDIGIPMVIQKKWGDHFFF